METTMEYNKKLIERYPFLQPRNRWTDKISEDYNYDYTELDDMPDGWRIAFGEQMCEEIKQELLKMGKVQSWDEEVEAIGNYRIMQIKEKFGELRWYDRGGNKEIYNIIGKYTALSRHTCIHCGKPATQISTGWICPWCDDCAKEIHDKLVPIENFYK